MQMVKLGKLLFRQYNESDLDLLISFCNKCKDLNYHNNVSLETIKYDKMKMPYGQFFIGIDTEKEIIFSMAGVHKLDQINPNAWRCLFRGATLPKYSRKGSLDSTLFNSFQTYYLLHMQMQFIKEQFEKPEFYLSTNCATNKETRGKSNRMDLAVHRTLLKNKIFSKAYSEVELFNTKQNIWKLNEEEYYRARANH